MSTSQQPLGGIKVYVDFGEVFGLVTVLGVNVAGHEIPLPCFSPAQLELWRVDIQIEVETEERMHLESQAEIFDLDAYQFENRVE